LKLLREIIKVYKENIYYLVDMLAVEGEEFVTNLCKVIVRDEKLNKLGI
jgi:hypothetical protein